MTMLKEYLHNTIKSDIVIPNTNNIDLWKYQIQLEKELERIEIGVKINFFWALQEGETQKIMYLFYGMRLLDGKLYVHSLSNKEEIE